MEPLITAGRVVLIEDLEPGKLYVFLTDRYVTNSKRMWQDPDNALGISMGMVWSGSVVIFVERKVVTRNVRWRDPWVKIIYGDLIGWICDPMFREFVPPSSLSFLPGSLDDNTGEGDEQED